MPYHTIYHLPDPYLMIMKMRRINAAVAGAGHHAQFLQHDISDFYLCVKGKKRYLVIHFYKANLSQCRIEKGLFVFKCKVSVKTKK